MSNTPDWTNGIMIREPSLEDLWDRLNDFYEVLVGQLTKCNDQLWSEATHQETPVFSFGGYLSLGRDRSAGDEDLVVEWSVQRRDQWLRVTADISRGDGTVLAELPAEELMKPVDGSKLAESQEQAMRFFRKNIDLIKGEVC
jgi:hypothetical protein